MTELYSSQPNSLSQESDRSQQNQEIAAFITNAQFYLRQTAAETSLHKGKKTAESEKWERHAKLQFEEAVKLTFDDTYTLAYRLTSQEEDARDVTQETYLRAWRALLGFRGDSEFTTWLFRITVNTANTHMGRRLRHRHAQYEDTPEKLFAISGGEEESAENSLLSRKLQAALGALTPNLRKVVVLRDIYDLTHEAIARELGISENAAKVRLHRARRQLRDELGKNEDD